MCPKLHNHYLVIVTSLCKGREKRKRKYCIKYREFLQYLSEEETKLSKKPALFKKNPLGGSSKVTNKPKILDSLSSKVGGEKSDNFISDMKFE